VRQNGALRATCCIEKPFQLAELARLLGHDEA
jgi:hypothetical protein